jgi:hypothetical protein
MFFYPWYPAFMLAVETSNVIDIRLRKIASGKVDAATETQLMISEKIDAIAEASAILFRGGNPLSVIDNYRKYVAANFARLAD